MASDKKIAKLVDEIVNNFHPRKIILFGSHARGRADSGSDVDLLVVMPRARNTLDAAVSIRQKVNHDFALDIIVRTPRQIEQRLHWGDSFIREIVEKGKTLYEAPDPGMD